MKDLWIKSLLVSIIFISIGFSEELTDKQISDNKILSGISEVLFREIMNAKNNLSGLNVITRDELLSNLSSTGPRIEFIVHADIESDLGNGILSSNLYVSTNNQSSWALDDNIALIGTSGYENTWQGMVQTNGTENVNWYISALVNSEVLGESFGNIIVSQSPNNINNQWPPINNLYSTLGTDVAGDASSSQDIISIQGGFSGPWDLPEGNTDRLYLGLTLNGGCCDAGSTFGPWYLYGIGIVNPESDSQVAYAIGYGDGGFGELSPGLLKLTGDLASGDISGFEYISTDINWTSAGSQLHTSVIMDYITNDPDWGPWPNSMNGIIVLGVTVEASLSGFDVEIAVSDQTDPGLLILSSQYQSGNTSPVISNLDFNNYNQTISVNYIDENGNLPWKHNASICESGTMNSVLDIDLIPDSHAYSEGLVYSAQINSENIEPGSYDLKVFFNDSDEADQLLVLENFLSFYGCNDETACNYSEGTLGCDDGSINCCEFPDINYDCLGNCIDEIDCFGICGGGAIIDECGVCGGSSACDCPGFPDETVPDCLGECGGPAVYDECGVCNGNGIPDGACDCEGHVFDECGICGGSGIAIDACDCDGNTLDCEGVCGGTSEFDECGICLGENECFGCIDTYALNYDSGATLNDGSCEYNLPSNLVGVFDQETETILLTWDTAIIEPEDPCPNEGELLDCNGNCAPTSWIGDGYCDDGSYFYSTTYGYCGNDSANLPAEDCIAVNLICEDLNFDDGDCDLDCPPDYILDCYGVCVPASWIGDGYCDVGQWGAFLYCESGSFDGGDCGSCSDLSEVQDCNGDCWPYDVIGDGWCDDDIWGTDLFNWEEDFDCATFNYDGGDCSGDPAENPNDNEMISYQRSIKQLPSLRIKDNYNIDDSIPVRDEIYYKIIRNQINLTETMDLFYNDQLPLYGENCYSVTALFPFGESSATDEVCLDAELSIQLGDINGDGNIDVVDVVNMVNYILDDTPDFDIQLGDMNADGYVDVVDIVLLINLILD